MSAVFADMKELRMSNGDVVDAEDIEAIKTEEGWVAPEDHRLADAEPATVPEDAPRDDNDDPIFNES
jgi:hypothetical protein